MVTASNEGFCGGRHATKAPWVGGKSEFYKQDDGQRASGSNRVEVARPFDEASEAQLGLSSAVGKSPQIVKVSNRVTSLGDEDIQRMTKNQ